MLNLFVNGKSVMATPPPDGTFFLHQPATQRQKALLQLEDLLGQLKTALDPRLPSSMKMNTVIAPALPCWPR